MCSVVPFMKKDNWTYKLLGSTLPTQPLSIPRSSGHLTHHRNITLLKSSIIYRLFQILNTIFPAALPQKLKICWTKYRYSIGIFGLIKTALTCNDIHRAYIRTNKYITMCLYKCYFVYKLGRVLVFAKPRYWRKEEI